MQTIETEPEFAESERLDADATNPRDLVFALSRIYLEVGLKPADALRSAVADFDSYFSETSPCAS